MMYYFSCNVSWRQHLHAREYQYVYCRVSQKPPSDCIGNCVNAGLAVGRWFRNLEKGTSAASFLRIVNGAMIWPRDRDGVQLKILHCSTAYVRQEEGFCITYHTIKDPEDEKKLRWRERGGGGGGEEGWEGGREGGERERERERESINVMKIGNHHVN